jgi:uncharacterized protein
MKLEIGYNHHFEVRKEKCTNSIAESFSVLYLSDFHFNKYSKVTTKNIIDKINELNPDIILLGGDYVDTKKGMTHFITLLQSIAIRKNVFAVAGNHDYFFGLSEIKDILTINSANWIEKKSFSFQLNNTIVQIDGNNPQPKKDAATFSILCLHKPIDISCHKENYNLVLGGHLHGGQFVFWKSNNGLYPGKLFYKWNIIKKKLNNCQYFVSKGLGDTLPIRFNCKKDMIFVSVGKNIVS